MTDMMNLETITLDRLFNKTAKRYTFEKATDGIVEFEPVNSPEYGLIEKPASVLVYVRIKGFCVGKQTITPDDEVYNKIVVLKEMKVYDDSGLTFPDDSYWKLGYCLYWHKNNTWFEIGRDNFYYICEGRYDAANHTDFVNTLEKVIKRHLSYSDYRHKELCEQMMIRVIPVPDEPIKVSRRARVKDKFRKGIIPMIGKASGLGMEIKRCFTCNDPDDIGYKVYYKTDDDRWEYTGYDGLITDPNFFGKRFIGEDLVTYNGRPYNIDIDKTAVIMCDNKPYQISFDEGNKLIYDTELGDFRKMNDSDYISLIVEPPYTAKFIPYTANFIPYIGGDADKD